MVKEGLFTHQYTCEVTDRNRLPEVVINATNTEWYLRLKDFFREHEIIFEEDLRGNISIRLINKDMLRKLGELDYRHKER